VTLEQLRQAIRAACHVSDDNELWIFGSQAILGSYPDAPDSLLTSIEVDVQPKNKPEAVDRVDGPLGELSLFHETHGFYVHGFPISATKLPSGWESRVIKVEGLARSERQIGWCLEPHDLAASKLAANREKDRAYVRTLLVEKMIEPAELIQRLQTLEIDDQERRKLQTWVEITSEDLR
jgi:hypothetical protein